MADDFARGYAAALAAYYHHSGGESVLTGELLAAADLASVEKLRAAGVDDLDVKRLRPLILVIRRRRKAVPRG